MALLYDIAQVHRRTTAYGGPGEALNEPGLDGKGLIVRGRHIVLLDNFVNSTVYRRTIGEMLMMNPHPIFAPDAGSPSDYMKNYFTNVGITLGLVDSISPWYNITALLCNRAIIRYHNNEQFQYILLHTEALLI